MVDEGYRADGRYHRLLDVVPADVVDAAREPDALGDVVLGADLETVDRVGAEGSRSRRNAERLKIRCAGGLRQRVVGAARPESLGVGEVVHVVRIHLELQPYPGREGVLLVAARACRRRREQLRTAR